MAINEEVTFTLREAVAEVLGKLTGLELQYDPDLNRFQAIARQINAALRSVATEKEWSYYSDTLNIGAAGGGAQEMALPANVRPRIINDDSVRLIRDCDDAPLRWAYVLPRDAIHKYRWMDGLWVSYTRSTIMFSRPLSEAEGACNVVLPVMREPIMFRIPVQPEDPEEDLIPVPEDVLEQEVDFPYPDLVILKAAFFYAQSDPVMQPRVQTLEAQYKDIMYQLIERDERNTDSPFTNDFVLPIHSGIDSAPGGYHLHPHADSRRW